MTLTPDELVDEINTLGLMFRRARGDLSQREFARRLGISDSMVASIELGRRIPSVRIIRRLAALTRDQ